MAVLLDIHGLRAQEASAFTPAALNSGRTPHCPDAQPWPVLATGWTITPDGRLACFWRVENPDLDLLSG
jgi:hypothetical protein